MSLHADVERARRQLPGRWFAFSARGERRYDDVMFEPDDVLVFGTERTGLRDDVLADFAADRLLTIPMMPNNRSLNLANAVAVVVYEAWRQRGFSGATSTPNDGLTSETSTSAPFDP